MLNRASRQSIASYILSGSQLLKEQKGSFDERLKEGEKTVSNCLTSFGLSEEQKDELTFREGLLLDLYFEEGVKIGSLLSRNLSI